MDNSVNHPAHYGGADNPYETIKILKATLTLEEYRGFLKGNILKYNQRAEKKNGMEDYKKALWYQKELCELREDYHAGL